MNFHRYKLPDGRILFISDGISNGRTWMTAYRKSTGTLKRLISASLPLRSSPAAAQADLDAYCMARDIPAIETTEVNHKG